MEKILITSFLFVFLAGCIKSPFETSVPQNYNKKNPIDIIQNRCMSCHKNYNYTSNDEWIKSGLINTAKPNDSILLRSLRGFSHAGKRNMPPKPQPALSSEEIDTLFLWVSSMKKDSTAKKQIQQNQKYSINKNLNEKMVFQRCFEYFTKHPYSNNIFNKYRNLNKKSPCQALLNEVSAGGDYKQDILRTFQNIHNSWFNSYNFHTNNENWGTFEIMDPNTAGYYFTEVLIHQKKVSNIFKGNLSPKAIRKGKESPFLFFRPNENIKINSSRAKYLLGNNPEKPIPWDPKPARISNGKLTDVTFWNQNSSKINSYFKNDLEREPVLVNSDYFKGFGGGILGDKTYLALTFGHSPGLLMDGAQKVTRSWSKSVFKNLLCRDLPVINGSDAVELVNQKSKISFQRSVSCMTCHASIDPLAGATRHFTVGLNNLISEAVDPDDTKSFPLQTLVPLSTEEFLDKSKLNKYLKEEDNSTLRFRDIHGKLHEKNFENIDQLAKYISNLDDFYYCLSKRYIESFTGHQVSINNLFAVSDNKTQNYLKSLIISEGQKLKKHQSLLNLSYDIVNSPLYYNKDFQVDD